MKKNKHKINPTLGTFIVALTVGVMFGFLISSAFTLYTDGHTTTAGILAGIGAFMLWASGAVTGIVQAVIAYEEEGRRGR